MNMNCDPTVDYLMVDDIVEYIGDEMKDSRYYERLAAQAPTPRSRDLLMEFSREEWTHAQNLIGAYHKLTGRNFVPAAVEEPVIPPYEEALKQRILAETADYKKYGIKYQMACDPGLKSMFYGLRTTEAQHAMRIPILMEEE